MKNFAMDYNKFKFDYQRKANLLLKYDVLFNE